MPCFDAGPSREQMQADELNRRIAEAMLCAMLRTEDGQKAAANLTDSDMTKAGVTRDQFKSWWIKHVRVDQEREAKEAKEAELKKLKLDALEKLTPEERAILHLD